MDGKQFDGYRQSVYEQAASIVDKHDAYRNAGQLDVTALAYFIHELDTLMASFNSTYLANRASSPIEVFQGKLLASWIDPRFHDTYDFFTNISSGWKADLAAMQASQTSFAPSSPGTSPAVSQPSGWTPYAAPGTTPVVNVTTNVPGLLEPPSLLPVPGYSSGTDGPPAWGVPGEEEPVSQAGISPLLGLGLVAGLLLTLGRSGRRSHAKG